MVGKHVVEYGRHLEANKYSKSLLKMRVIAKCFHLEPKRKLDHCP